MRVTNENTEEFSKKWFLDLIPYLVLVALVELVAVLSWIGPYPSKVKLIVAFLIPYVLVLICGTVSLFHRWMVTVWQFVVTQVKSLRNHHWKKGLLMVLADVVAASVAERILAWIGDGSLTAAYNFRKAIFAFVVLFVISLFVVFRDEMRTRVEIIIFFVIMSIGTAYVTTMPVSCGISWDDETHFHYTIYAAHMLHGNMNEGDAAILTQFYSTAVDHALYTEEEHSAWLEQLNAAGASGASGADGRVWPKLEYWCYIPAAIGYNVGLALHLPYMFTFILGQWCNLLVYALLIYFAVKRIKTGKMLVACVAMLPPNILMATTYGRDAYMIGFIMLGFCYLMGELQEPEKKLTVWDMVIIVGSFFLGVMPKAVYGPLVLMALCLPKSKFKTQKQCRIYRAWVIGVTVLVMATFVLPFLVSGGGSVEDPRGGADVGAASQTSFMLAHPLQYLVILFNFMKGYLSLTAAQQGLGAMHYFGASPYSLLLIVLLFVVACTDREESYERRIKLPVRIVGVVMSLGALILCATAMYIAFTPVGSETILGCQWRYQMQVMFPMLYLIFGIPLNNKMDKLWYRGIVLGISSFVVMQALWANCIATF